MPGSMSDKLNRSREVRYTIEAFWGFGLLAVSCITAVYQLLQHGLILASWNPRSWILIVGGTILCIMLAGGSNLIDDEEDEQLRLRKCKKLHQ